LKKRAERLELHEVNMERMENELDIIALVKSLRLSEFVHQTHLSEYQRYFVNKFRNYHLDHEIEINEYIKDRSNLEQELTESGYTAVSYEMKTLEEMTTKLSIDSAIDRRIIHEVIGVKVNPEDSYGILEDEDEPKDRRFSVTSRLLKTGVEKPLIHDSESGRDNFDDDHGNGIN
jgi:hypothetical protein